MSNGLTGVWTDAPLEKAGAGVLRLYRIRALSGAGMLEFLVALLIFSVGMMALLSAQVVGQKAGFEASQRSIATTLVRDILERMRANPGQVLAYQVDGVGDEANPLPRPDIDCDAVVCTAEQLVAFDLWQWEALLLGYSAQDSVGYAGGLFDPWACIRSDGRAVQVTISWRGVLVAAPTPETDCVKSVDVDEEPEVEAQNVPQRHQLTVSTWMAQR